MLLSKIRRAPRSTPFTSSSPPQRYRASLATVESCTPSRGITKPAPRECQYVVRHISGRNPAEQPETSLTLSEVSLTSSLDRVDQPFFLSSAETWGVVSPSECPRTKVQAHEPLFGDTVVFDRHLLVRECARDEESLVVPANEASLSTRPTVHRSAAACPARSARRECQGGATTRRGP